MTTQQHWPSLDRLQRQRDQMRLIIKALDDELYETLLRWAGESGKPLEEGAGTAIVDGYPTRSAGSGDAIRGGSDSTPTERAALNDRELFDVIDRALMAFFAKHSEVAGVMRELNRARIHLQAHGAEVDVRRPSRPGAGNCEACGVIVSGEVKDGSIDRLVSGYCGRCRKRWERAGYPDRMAFRARVRADLAAKNQHAAESA